ncbi:MAG: membrane dipeptidase [Thermoproteus sp.]
MIYDLHEDISYYYFVERKSEFDVDEAGRQSDLPKLKRAEVDLVFASIFPIRYSSLGASPAGSKETSLEMFKIIYRLATRHEITIVERAADLNRSGLKFLISLEGADALDEPEDLLLYYRLGLRAVGITWNLDNKYGASCMTKRDYGLTAYGVELVELANRLGVVIDLAHASKNTALDVLYISKKPVVISHANVAAVYKTNRNVDDEVLEALKRNGGVIGLTAIPSTIGGDGSVRDLVRHALYVKETFGAELLAIGSDALGVDRMAVGMESIDKLPIFLDLLRSAGFSEDEIEGIAYKNAKRVIEANLS